MANEGFLADLLGVREVRVSGVPAPTRRAINFLGGVVVASDNPAADSTDLSITPSAVPSVEVKPVAKCATTANITLTGLGTHDGVAVNANDLVFVRAQTTASQNGLYRASAGAWTRDVSFDTSSDVAPGTIITVDQGTLFGGSVWRVATNAPIVLGSTALAFSRIDGGVATQLRNAAISAATPAANDVLAYTSGTACGPTKLVDAHIASNAAIQLAKLATGSNGQILKMVAGQWSGATLSPADFGESVIAATPAASQDSWSPAGWSTATIVNMSPSTTCTLLGLAAVTSGAIRKVMRNEGSAAVVVQLASSSTAANSFAAITGIAYVAVLPGSSLTVYYDTSAGRWKVASAEGGTARDNTGLRLCGSAAEVLYYDATGAAVARRARRKAIPRSAFRPYGVPDASSWYLGASSALTCSGATNVSCGLELELPAGARLIGIEMLRSNFGALSFAPALSVQQNTLDKTSPYTANSAVAPVSAAAGSMTSGQFLHALTCSIEWSSTAAVSLNVSSGIGALQAIEWADMLFDDPGPRNY